MLLLWFYNAVADECFFPSATHKPQSVCYLDRFFCNCTYCSSWVGINLYLDYIVHSWQVTRQEFALTRVHYVPVTGHFWENVPLQKYTFLFFECVKHAPCSSYNESVSCRHQHTPRHLGNSRAQHSHPNRGQRIQCPPASKQRAAHLWAHLHQWYPSLPRWAN